MELMSLVGNSSFVIAWGVLKIIGCLFWKLKRSACLYVSGWLFFKKIYDLFYLPHFFPDICMHACYSNLLT